MCFDHHQGSARDKLNFQTYLVDVLKMLPANVGKNKS